MNFEQLQDIVLTCAAAIDEIDRHECAPTAVATGISHMLKLLGYSEVDCYAAGALAQSKIERVFSRMYWNGDIKTNSKVIALLGATNTAIKIIEDGQITDEQRQQTAQILADARKTDVQP